MTEAVPRLYAGLDLHAKNVYAAIRDAQGQCVWRRRLPNDLPTILQALTPFRAQLQALAVESTFNWYWLVDGLQSAQFPVRLANPAKMDQYQGLKQTDDESDALWIAELLRLGILPEGYIYPKELRPVRDLLRRRLLVVRQRTQLLLSLQSMVTRHTGAHVKTALLREWTLKELSQAFPDPVAQQTAAGLLDLIREQDRIEDTLQKQALGTVKLCGAFRRLLTLPGVGPALGVTIKLETGPITRFASAGDYASYCRVVNSRCESDGKKKGENNRKNGNKYLGWAYVEAAHFAQRYNPRAQAWFASKAARAGRVVAVKALACKLAKAAYYVMRDEFPNTLY